MLDDKSKLTFTDRDEFQRRSIAEKVINLLKSDIDVSPMVIDGGWGTGKTEFCLKLINLMSENDTHHLIYVDAFKADHANEPLLTILSEVVKILPDDPSREKVIKKLIPAIRFGAKVIGKGAIAHILRQDATKVVDDFDKEIQQVTDKAIDASVEALLKEHVKAEENLNKLQTVLEGIAESKPIVIFIDELDRCRPDFSVSMLEIIKHIFAIAGVKFVLVTNSNQLKASINHCYGHSVDAQRYLDKFLKFRFELTQRTNRQHRHAALASRQHFFALVKTGKYLPENYLKNELFGRAVEHLIKHLSLSLREVETVVRYIHIAQVLSSSEKFLPNQYLGFTLLRLLGVFIFCFEPKIVSDLSKGIVDSGAIGEFIGITELTELGNDSIRPEAFEVIMVMLARDCNRNADLYKPKDEHLAKWDKYINNGFMGRFPPDPNDAIEEIRQMIALLALEH